MISSYIIILELEISFIDDYQINLQWIKIRELLYLNELNQPVLVSRSLTNFNSTFDFIKPRVA